MCGNGNSMVITQTTYQGNNDHFYNFPCHWIGFLDPENYGVGVLFFHQAFLVTTLEAKVCFNVMAITKWLPVIL